MSKVVAVGFRVHVTPDKTETEKAASKAGIALPDYHHDVKQARVAVDTGVVTDIGPTAWAEFVGDPWVKVGDRVVYARHAGYRVGDDVLIINDADVVAKLED